MKITTPPPPHKLNVNNIVQLGLGLSWTLKYVYTPTTHHHHHTNSQAAISKLLLTKLILAESRKWQGPFFRAQWRTMVMDHLWGSCCVWGISPVRVKYKPGVPSWGNQQPSGLLVADLGWDPLDRRQEAWVWVMRLFPGYKISVWTIILFSSLCHNYEAEMIW